jgi:hypothetical protein
MTRSHTRASRVLGKTPLTLTPRGERVLGCAYTALILIGATVALLAALALAGAIEGGF